MGNEMRTFRSPPQPPLSKRVSGGSFIYAQAAGLLRLLHPFRRACQKRSHGNSQKRHEASPAAALAKALPWSTPLLITVMLSGCGTGPDGNSKSSAQAEKVNPVAVLSLTTTVPDSTQRQTGSVATWKRVAVGFEVGGRVLKMLDTGTDVNGPLFDPTGKVVQKGSLLAELDATDAHLKIKSAQARLHVLKAQGRASKVQLDEVFPQELSVASAHSGLRDQEYERVASLQETGASTKSELDRVTAARQSARAKLASAKARLKAQEARFEASKAQVMEQRQVLRAAEIDLERCKLYAPFRGRVAQVHVISGGVVRPGMPVATLVVMDPIKIEVAVSAKTDRTLHVGDHVRIYSAGSNKAVAGWIQSKDTSADVETRTFKIQIMTRNVKISDDPTNGSAKHLPVHFLRPLVKLVPNRPGPWFVDTDCLYHVDGKYFVWSSGRKSGDPWNPTVALRKIAVIPGQLVFDLVGTASYRELIGADKLGARMEMLAAGVPLDFKNGGKATLVRERWWTRPGDVVKVEWSTEPSKPGHYVPMKAILIAGGKHYVYLAREEKGIVRAIKTHVRLTGRDGEQRRIEGIKTPLLDRTEVVVRGAHYLTPGCRLRVVERLSAGGL